jgi:hypothetical protein
MATINLVPPRLDIIAYGGDDTRIVFNLQQDEEPYVFTGTQSAQIRVSQNGEDSWDLEVELDTEVDGRAYVTIPSEVAAELVVDAEVESVYVGDELVTAPMFIGVWDWQFDNGGDVKTLVFGDIKIIGEVTR